MSMPTDAVRPLVPCAHCGAPIDPQTAVYSRFGTLICRSCEGVAMVHETQQRGMGGIAYGALGAGIGAWVLMFVPLFGGLLSLGVAIAGIVTGARALQLMARPEYKVHPGRGGMMACAILGIVFGGLFALVFLLGVIGLAVLWNR